MVAAENDENINSGLNQFSVPAYFFVGRMVLLKPFLIKQINQFSFVHAIVICQLVFANYCREHFYTMVNLCLKMPGPGAYFLEVTRLFNRR